MRAPASRGHEVICVDNFYTGKKRNIAHLLSDPDFELLRHDITLPLYIEVDQIYNLACPASPIHYQFDPVQTTKTCVHAPSTCSDWPSGRRRGSCRLRPARFMATEVHPQEAYRGAVNPTGIRACYDEGKRCAETLFFDYQRQHGVDIRVARIFNTYGPRMHPNDGRVVSNFVVQALEGRPLTIFGDGSQTRAFCYVDDLVDGLVRLMNVESDGVRAGQFRNPVEMSILPWLLA